MNSLIYFAQAVMDFAKPVIVGMVIAGKKFVEFIGKKISDRRRNAEKHRKISRIEETISSVTSVLMLFVALFGLASAIVTLIKNAKKLFD